MLLTIANKTPPTRDLGFLLHKHPDHLQTISLSYGTGYVFYGPEYNTDINLNTLRQRGLSKKRSMAIREFALGIEALNRFVNRGPLRRVHECVFGVMALESEPVDPRL